MAVIRVNYTDQLSITGKYITLCVSDLKDSVSLLFRFKD